MSEVLTRGGLEQWLRGWEPEAVVGFAGCETDCPLATFLRAQGGVRPLILGQRWEMCEDDEDHPMPPWAAAYVVALDAAYDPPPYPDDIRRADQRPVTAAEALAVLRALELPQEVEA